MQKLVSAAICIILGLVIMAFPLLGVFPIEILTSVAIMFVAIGLITTGLTSTSDNAVKGLVKAFLGVFALIVGFALMFSPLFFSFAAAIFVFLSGIFMILAGIAGLATKSGSDTWSSVAALIMGILYMLVAIFVANPFYLGFLIGLWLLITGILYIFQKD